MNSLQDNCVHFWDIPELAIDGVWHGACRKCGVERDFAPEYNDRLKNYWTDRKRAEEAQVA